MGLLREIKQALGLDTDRDDIRGWDVVDGTGTVLGRVDDLMYDPDSSYVRYAIVEQGGRRVLLPMGDLSYDEGARRVIATGYTQERFMGLRPYDATRWNETEERETYKGFMPSFQGQTVDYADNRFRGEVPQRIKLLEERLNVGKVNERAGEVTLGKRPITEQVQEQVTLAEDKLDITRHRVDRPATGEIIGTEAETISVPLYAERAEVRKDTFVREEVEVNKRREEHIETVNDTVRHEELVTEGLDRPKRELSFAGTEPTDEEILEGDRLRQQQIITPMGDRTIVDNELGENI